MKRSSFVDSKSDIGWGSRDSFLCPLDDSRIKDLRTGIEKFKY